MEWKSEELEIRELISKNELKSALEKLYTVFPDSAISYKIDLLKGRLTALDEKSTSGIVDNRDFLLEENNIRYDLIKILQKSGQDSNKELIDGTIEELSRKNSSFENKYIRDRVDNQLYWFEKKGFHYIKKYKRSRIVIVSLAGTITLISNLIGVFDKNVMSILIGLLGIFIILIEFTILLDDSKTNGDEYRKIASSLQKEKLLFINKVDKYENLDNPFNLFVKNIEEQIKHE